MFAAAAHVEEQKSSKNDFFQPNVEQSFWIHNFLTKRRRNIKNNEIRSGKSKENCIMSQQMNCLMYLNKWYPSRNGKHHSLAAEQVGGQDLMAS